MGIVDFQSQGTINASLLPKRFDLEIYQGDTLSFTITLKDSLGVVKDITGWTPLGQIRSLVDNTVIDTFTITVDGPNGILTVSIPNTGTITAGSYKYDIQTTDTSTNVRTWIGGNVTVIDDITEVI